MKNQKFSKTVRLISFLLIATLLFCFVSDLLERKTLYGQANYMGKLDEFYELPENSLEYICVGSSHAYCTINPLEIWNDSGIKGFVLATQRQPLRASYHYIKEAFKTQSPKVVILEGLMGMHVTFEEDVLYDAIDPLRPSLNKFQMINALVEPKKRDAYYFNVLKYHTRWKDIATQDILDNLDAPKDGFKGFIPLNGQFSGINQIPDYTKIEAAKIPEENLSVLNDILSLVKENDAELVLMFAPYEIEGFGGVFKAEYEWATKNGVEIIDYALKLDELGIDPEKDYYDIGHLDISGAAKVSKHLSGFLKSKNLTSTYNDEGWKNDFETYLEIAQ